MSQKDVATASTYFETAARLDPAFLQARARWVEFQSFMMATGFPAISTDPLRHVVEDMRRRAPNDENTLYADDMRLRLGADQDSSGRAWSRLLAAAPNNPIVLMNAAGDRFWVRADPAGSWPLMSRAVQLAPRNVEVLGAAAFTALYNGTICNDRSSRTGPAYLHEVVVDEPADRLGSC